jgi:hypothetical protein
LAHAEPDRADYQRDLAISLMQIGVLTESAEALSRALAILSSLAAAVAWIQWIDRCLRI